MMRVTTIPGSDKRTAVAVEGSITGEYSQLLESACTGLLDAGRVLELDLSYVDHVDSSGLAALRRLRTRQAAIVACPAFILELVDRDLS